jgi:hypothetical protein
METLTKYPSIFASVRLETCTEDALVVTKSEEHEREGQVLSLLYRSTHGQHVVRCVLRAHLHSHMRP